MLYRADKITPFCRGFITYRENLSQIKEQSPRIVITIRLEGLDIEALVDTGASFLIIDPEIANTLKILRNQDSVPSVMIIRGERVIGFLSRQEMDLVAEEGASMKIEATVFVPDDIKNPEWGGTPNFLGYGFCLERLCFAIDPQGKKFHFGEGN